MFPPTALTPPPSLLRAAKFAVQIALVFAKVARVDYPRYWPGLVDDLLAVLRGGDALRRRRGYLVLHHVLKELSSKRLASDQRTFAQVRDDGRVADEVTGKTGTWQK